jgi:hypothetical protein
VDEEHKPHPPSGVIERDSQGKPTKIVCETREHAEKLLATMGLSLSDPSVVIEERTEPPPTLSAAIAAGGEEGFRGILKIAYEFVRGHQNAVVTDANSNAEIVEAILGSRNASEFVRWLPYEMFAPFGTPYFSHHVMPWQQGSDVLVVVELFNAFPYVVRLPGLEIQQAVVFVQGIQGEDPFIGFPSIVPTWSWAKVPLHGQPQMFKELEARLAPLIETMQYSDLLRMACESAGVTVLDAAPTDSIDEMTNAAFAKLQKAVPSVSSTDTALRDFVRAMVTHVHESRDASTPTPDGSASQD